MTAPRAFHGQRTGIPCVHPPENADGGGRALRGDGPTAIPFGNSNANPRKDSGHTGWM